MQDWHPQHFQFKKENLEKRVQIIKGIRRFFDSKRFIEVETPALQVSPGLEPHLKAFKTCYEGWEASDSQDYYLHTSPEFAMKKLLTAGMHKIYQIASVFRNGERSKTHHPEFKMLEWYRAGEDYVAIMEDVEGLIVSLADVFEIDEIAYQSHVCNLRKGFERISVCEAFQKYAEIDLEDCLGDREALARQATDKWVRISDDDRWDDIFFKIFLEKIEPFLGVKNPCILYDYPISMAALSKMKLSDSRFAERFEVYICGLELANAFTELTDPIEQKRRFEKDMDLKERLYGERYPIDADFIKALEFGMPESAGIALGVDRLVMLFTGAEKIEDVLFLSV
jgi:lysyl-tRNA synthetase class 2